MLINNLAPRFQSITGIADTAALCSACNGIEGLGFEPSILATSILGPLADFWKTQQQTKIAKKQIQFQESQLRTEKEYQARQMAVDTAEALASQSASARREQVYAMVGITGAAIVISILLITSAAKAKRGSQ